MIEFFLLLSMIFFHIVDDFYSQPIILSNLKQKAWWEENASDKKYEKDYLMALFLHAFSWTFMVHIPVIVYTYMNDTLLYYHVFDVVIMFILQLLIHFIIDDLKANKLKLNLIVDQSVHIIQVISIWLYYTVF